MIWAVVMAGGVGSRFWPLSRRKLPKQLLPLMGKKTMIEETVARLKPFIPEKRILVVTNAFQKLIIRKLLKTVPSQNIIVEPLARNTAPCLALAALHIEKEDPEAIFVALPADHLIRNTKGFRRYLKVACELARKDKHIVFGIPPTSSHTGYGYIRCKNKVGERRGVNVYQGWEFVEKPPLWQAKAFLRSGKYFWNSGMFVWKLSFFLRTIRENLPTLGRELVKMRSILNGNRRRKSLRAIFLKLPNISIDYGLMEKVRDDLFVIKAGFDWSDVGSWRELEDWEDQDSFGNTLVGRCVAFESLGNIVRADKRLVTLLGVRDLIVVDTDDALLVSRKDKAQDVKKLVDELQRRKLGNYL